MPRAVNLAAPPDIVAGVDADGEVRVLLVDATGSLVLATLPLPPGAATAARQDTGNTSLASVAAALAGTLAVGAASLPLPAGAATEATLAKVPGLAIPIYDYVGVAYPDGDTETYTFKTGGSAGTTVATVTVDYVDSTKAQLSAVTKT